MPPAESGEVGQQLRRRREDLGLTQEDVAKAVGITTRTIQLTEHGRTTIRLGKRERWERALDLQRGAISRAYRDGRDLEALDAPAVGPEPWDRIEWELYSEAQRDGLAEEHARERVQIFRTHVRGWPLRRDWTPPDDAQRQDRLA